MLQRVKDGCGRGGHPSFTRCDIRRSAYYPCPIPIIGGFEISGSENCRQENLLAVQNEIKPHLF